MSRFTKMVFLFLSITLGSPRFLPAQSGLDQRVGKEMDSLVATYKHLHENPELSTQEKESSALIAAELRKLGYDVTDHFGQYDSPGLVSYGIVGVLRNGPGPTVYVRTDMDALPVVENTGLLYASHVKVKRPDGAEVGVMHACGHDIHMSVFISAARMLAQLKDQWRGTLVLQTMNPAQREKVVAAIARIANGIAAAAGVPAERSLGKENVLPGEPAMAGEDFSLYALEDPKPPICMFWLGAADAAKLRDAREKGARRCRNQRFEPASKP